MSSLFALPVSRFPQRDLHGAALVDERGREIPITEAMILRACGLAGDDCVSAQYRALRNTKRRARKAG